jgi:hypothetical protein
MKMRVRRFKEPYLQEMKSHNSVAVSYMSEMMYQARCHSTALRDIVNALQKQV